MKTSELREMEGPQLHRKAQELRRELLNLRFQQAGQQLKNPLRLRQVRREIARVLTLLKEGK
ncbi:50S ribosomal protein L29 [Candidatus Saganbacteria bacterium]|uniref:Large ribosomal subunit protein uL29 n=1 Tax=Candidatus Saganbacteria bacterium TaxID=2575572 RepID=A0A9D6UK69_UNCSA|nr:50S ribosomal protein L29 [Candidatus Saganbacteria bacterium]